MKRPLSRLRLTPRGRLRRNVVLLLLLPQATIGSFKVEIVCFIASTILSKIKNIRNKPNIS